MNANQLTRRSALRRLGGALSVLPFLRGVAARAADTSSRPPTRYLFVVRSNGILAPEIQPTTLPGLVKARSNGGWQRKGRFESLKDHTLSPGLAALEPLKDQVTLFQGLSGKMCSGSHNAGFGALGCFKSPQAAPPTKATVDGVLASHFRTPFAHVGFAMDQVGHQVVYPPLSATGPNQPIPYYADPLMAYTDLFGTVLNDAELKKAVQLDRSLLDFMVDDVKRFRKGLPSEEKEKLDHYLDGFEAMRARQSRLKRMENNLRKAAPELNDDYRSDIETERLEAHFEMAASALIGGLTRVVAIRADHMEMRLTGLGLGSKTVHGIGHMIEGKKGGNGGEAFADGRGEFAIRQLILDYHMKQIAALAGKLQQVPEGEGTMLDNTVILYLSDHGDRHHSKFYEWPMVAVGSAGGQLKTGQYLHFPGYASPGHQTIANLYLTLLKTAGIEKDGFGYPDMSLPNTIEQQTPLANWLA